METRNIEDSKGLSLMKTLKYPLLVFLFFLFYSLAAYFHLHDYPSDFWSHAAILRELTRFPLQNLKLHLWNTSHLLGPIPYSYDPYTLALASIQKLSHLPPLTLLKFFGPIHFLLWAIGLHLFLKEYFLDPDLSFLLLPILLFFWGSSWDFSGAYDIGGQVTNLYSPYSFAFGLSFFILFFFVKYLRGGGLHYAIFLIPLLTLLILVNLLPALFTLGTAALLFFLEKKKAMKTTLILIAILTLSLLLATSWPLFSLIKLIQEGFSLKEIFDPTYYFYWEHLVRLGPALLGLPLIFYYGCQRRHLLVTFGFFLFLFGYFLGFFLKNPIGWRLLFFIAFYSHLAIAIYLKENFSFKKPLTAGLVGIFLICVVYQMASLTAKQLGFRSFQEAFHFVRDNKTRGHGLEKRFEPVALKIAPEAIVLTDIDTGHLLPAFSGRPITYQEGLKVYDPFISGASERKKDIEEFFAIKTLAKRRLEILEKYRPAFVLWNEERVLHPLPKDLKKRGALLYQKDSLTLIQILR